MQLVALRDVVPDGSGRVYRQSRGMAVFSTVVFVTIFGGAPVLWYRLDAPIWVWGLCTALALLVVPMILGDLLAKLRSSNWVVWLRPDGLYVNFRSYQDASATDARCVVRLEYPEIAAAGKYVEKYQTPGSDGGNTHWSVTALDLELTHDRTDELAAALSENRKRPQPRRSFLGIGMTSRPAHFAVTLPEPNRLRIAWRGGTGNWIAPSLKHALHELSGYVPAATPTIDRAADWRELTDAQFDDRILKLIETGNRIEAISLLVARRGYTTTEAHQFVEELHAAV